MRLLFALAALLAASAANAQTPEQPGRGEARAKMLAADANSDGKWDKAEWLAAGRREQGFTLMDADKDGFVTRDELRTGMKKLMEARSL